MAEDYKLRIGGFYSGTGNGSLVGGSLSISGSVVTTDGGKGDFVVSNMVVTGNHFSGQGTVMGHKVTVSGRIDATDGSKAARIVANFTVADGHRGRIAGYVQKTGGGGGGDDGPGHGQEGHDD